MISRTIVTRRSGRQHARHDGPGERQRPLTAPGPPPANRTRPTSGNGCAPSSVPGAATASIVSRQAGSEDCNRYGALLSRMTPGPLVTRYYTRWLRQISSYLDGGPAGGGR